MRLMWIKAILLWLAVLGLAHTSLAGERILMWVQDAPLAGSQFHELDQCLPAIHVGDALRLVREPENPHDALAIRVYWQDCFLGYVPRRENRALAQAMDREESVRAKVTRLTMDRNPWLRLRFAVFAEL